ncbi:MAG: amidohydrolase family protein, partial [Leptospiraceae bacterium]|nr:amidohydrolase family protein [Leptospiraceae bacterium]
MDHCPHQLLATLPAASRRDRAASTAYASIVVQSNTNTGAQSDAINRRTFLRKSAGVAVAAGALGTITGCLSHFVAAAEHDIIIRGGLVYDGNGNDPVEVDVGIRGSRIISIGNMAGRSAGRVLDATGMMVCPGFVDIHGHSDLTILQDGQAESKIRQGVTTEIIGQDGRSLAPLSRQMQRGFKAYLENSLGIRMDWYDFQGYYNAILREGISINIRSMIGAGTLRENIMGYDRRKMESYEINSVQSLIRLATQQGARHLSSGLEYLPGSHAGTAELTALARTAGLYSTHMRNEDDAVLPALQEALTIADRAQAALNISHIKAQGNRNYDKLPTMLSMLDRARGWNRQVTCDRYPYLAYNTGLANLFPLDVREDGTTRFIQHLRDPDYYDRLRSDVEYKVASLGSYHGILIAESASSKYARFEGRRLDEVARILQKNPYDILVDMIISSGGSSTMIGFGMDEQNLHR